MSASPVPVVREAALTPLVGETERALQPWLLALPVANEAELAEVALQDRIDTKFILHPDKLARILTLLGSDYLRVQTNSEDFASYDTWYFDTVERRFLVDHLRGRLPRQKVRVRYYRERKLTFIEVKQKTNHFRTRKFRLELPEFSGQLCAQAHAFLRAHCAIQPGSLLPAVKSEFRRVMLVNPETRERFSADFQVQFRHGARQLLLPSVVIAEVKQARFSRATPLMRALRGEGGVTHSLSKYCLGMALAGEPELKTQSLEPSLRLLKKIAHA